MKNIVEREGRQKKRKIERDKKICWEKRKARREKKEQMENETGQSSSNKETNGFCFFCDEKWKCFFGDKFHSM